MLNEMIIYHLIESQAPSDVGSNALIIIEDDLAADKSTSYDKKC